MPGAEQAIVPPAKITEYLLSPDNPDGAGKAAFFVHFVFTRAQPDVLAGALRRHARTGRLTQTVKTSYGVKYVVDGPVATPDGRQPSLRTIWIVGTDLPNGAPRLVTAYPGQETAP